MELPHDGLRQEVRDDRNHKPFEEERRRVLSKDGSRVPVFS